MASTIYQLHRNDCLFIFIANHNQTLETQVNRRVTSDFSPRNPTNPTQTWPARVNSSCWGKHPVSQPNDSQKKVCANTVYPAEYLQSTF